MSIVVNFCTVENGKSKNYYSEFENEKEAEDQIEEFLSSKDKCDRFIKIFSKEEYVDMVGDDYQAEVSLQVLRWKGDTHA